MPHRLRKKRPRDANQLAAFIVNEATNGQPVEAPESSLNSQRRTEPLWNRDGVAG